MQFVQIARTRNLDIEGCVINNKRYINGVTAFSQNKQQRGECTFKLFRIHNKRW